MIKVAITDDHSVVLEGIASMLKNAEGTAVVSTNINAFETMEAIKSTIPDVLLLDINLPDENGIELTKKISKAFPSIRIIALTSYDDISFVKQMIKQGAMGYLLKNTSKEELLFAITTVMEGNMYLQKGLQEKIVAHSLGKKSQEGLIPKLTRREKEVLAAIHEEMTTQEISEKLFISPKTVETHRMNLMSKLGAKNSIGIIKAALKTGLLS